jgi:hypothetical protein
MGLDMYLRARRDITDPELIARALPELAKLKRYDDESDYFLPMWDHYLGKPEYEVAGTIIREIAGLGPIMGPDASSGYAEISPNGGVLTVSVTCVYWRKANQVHNWFVQNVQNGVDDCDEYPVDAEQLAYLVSLCDRVLADTKTARDLLPPASGFFFGGTDIDEWYGQDLIHTSEDLKRVINAAIQMGGITFAYQSSW